MGTNPTDGQNVVIGSVTHRFEGTMAQANDVKIGASQDITMAHLIATLNGTGAAGTDYYTGTVSPAAAARAVPQTATDLTNHRVRIYATTLGATGNLTSTTTVTSATWTAATLGTTGLTIDLNRLGPDGTTYTGRITQITASTGQQTISLAPGTYEWVIATSPVNCLEISRIQTAVE